MSETLWVVGRFKEQTENGVAWSLQGVFDKKEDAVKACRDYSYFIGPVTKNESLPHETIEWPGCEYPVIRN